MVNDSGFVTHEDMVKITKKNASFIALNRKAKAVGLNFEYMYICDGWPVYNFVKDKECEILLYIDGQNVDEKLKIRVEPRPSLRRKTDLVAFYSYVDKMKKAQKFVKWISEDFTTAGLPKCSKKADTYFPLGSFDARFVNAITEKIDAGLTAYFGTSCCRSGVRNADNIIVVTDDCRRRTNAIFCFHVFDLQGNRESTYYHEFSELGYSDCYIYKVLPPVNDDEYARFTVRKFVYSCADEDVYERKDEYETWAFFRNNSVCRVE